MAAARGGASDTLFTPVWTFCEAVIVVVMELVVVESSGCSPGGLLVEDPSEVRETHDVGWGPSVDCALESFPAAVVGTLWLVGLPLGLLGDVLDVVAKDVAETLTSVVDGRAVV